MAGRRGFGWLRAPAGYSVVVHKWALPVSPACGRVPALVAKVLAGSRTEGVFAHATEALSEESPNEPLEAWHLAPEEGGRSGLHVHRPVRRNRRYALGVG